jgi:myo-inositol-1(or 4)-monophosphatase
VDDLELAREAARRAAEVIKAWRSRLDGADYKGPVDPVTRADVEAEAAITDLLRAERPDDGVLAEEGSEADSKSGRRWVVDPLDGTVNFLHGVPQVAVSIALEVDGETSLGVIRDVFRSEEYTAASGGGAFLNGEPIRVSACSDLGRALVSTGFAYDRYERPGHYAAQIGAVLGRAQGIRRAGAAAIDLAWVACGRLDGHWEFDLSPWDVAAGFVLVTEAGGEVLGFDGPPSHRGFSAGPRPIARALREVVASVV